MGYIIIYTITFLAIIAAYWFAGRNALMSNQKYIIKNYVNYISMITAAVIAALAFEIIYYHANEIIYQDIIYFLEIGGWIGIFWYIIGAIKQWDKKETSLFKYIIKNIIICYAMFFSSNFIVVGFMNYGFDRYLMLTHKYKIALMLGLIVSYIVLTNVIPYLLNVKKAANKW